MSVVSICTGQGHTFDLFTLIYLEEETGLNFSLILLSFLHPPPNVLNRVITWCGL